MFNDFQFSKKKVFLIIELFNQHFYNYAEIKNILEIILQVLKVNDEYTLMRFEWLFGIPQINLKIVDGNLPRIPFSTTKFGDKLYKFESPVLYDTCYDTIIDKMLYKYSNNGDFLQIVTCFYLIILSNKELFNFYNSLPSPMLNCKYLNDYIVYLASEDLSKLLDLPTLTSSQDTTVKGMQKTLEKYEEIKKDNKNNSNYCLTPEYTFGPIVKEYITAVKDDGLNEKGVYLFIAEYETEIIKVKEKTEEKSKENNINQVSDVTQVIPEKEVIPEKQTKDDIQGINIYSTIKFIYLLIIFILISS